MSCARSARCDFPILPDGPVCSKQPIAERAVLPRFGRIISDRHHAYHLHGWKRLLYLNHDPVPARRRRELRRSDASHRERHRDIHDGVSIWMIFIGITMLDRLDLRGVIMEIVKSLLNGIATLIASLTACRCTIQHHCKTKNGGNYCAVASSGSSFHLSPSFSELVVSMPFIST